MFKPVEAERKGPVVVDAALRLAIVDEYYDELLAACLAWAQEQESIRAVIQVGSRARDTVPADEVSDLDLILFVTDPELYLADFGWLEAIEPVWIVIPSRTAGGDPELLVMFEGGYNADFVICAADVLRGAPRRNASDPALSRGARVLIDRDGRAAKHIPEVFGPPIRRAPTGAEFARVCDAFWYTAVYVARQIARGELWLAKVRDGTMKEQLLAMLEWHAGVQSHWHEDTWHTGRHIEEWVDPETREQINYVFGAYDADSARDALVATVRIFRRVAPEAAAGLGHTYPAKTEVRCMGLIHEAVGG
jgi:aminoglycoside 6-adenylyltransferase